MRPEETAVIFATISSALEQIATAQCYIEVGGERKCTAEIRASFVSREQLGADYHDTVLEEFLKHQGGAAL